MILRLIAFQFFIDWRNFIKHMNHLLSCLQGYENNELEVEACDRRLRTH